MNIQEVHAKQQLFFNSNKTKDVEFRLTHLKRLKQLLRDNESELYDAIYTDFGKSEFETYLTEFSLIYLELNGYIKHLKKWTKRKKVWSDLANFPSRSYVITEPLGVSLVIGAWNYPFQLSLLPALTSLAAGNTVILKPSELPSNTSKVMARLINDNFPSDYFCIIEGGVPETTELLDLKFDKIFFTGSTNVGRIVYQAAAKHLTPVTLELGGKSPTFVMADCDLKTTVQRIVWAKFINAGQTCVAPDYIFVEKSFEKQFLEALKVEIEKYFSENEGLQTNYLRIINPINFDRLNKLIDMNKVYCGGKLNREERIISPTVMTNVTFDDAVMDDEIFGPILPVISFENIDDAIAKVKERPKPLSCYIYSKNKKTINKILKEISFGGGAVNDSIMHLSNSRMPFGGVGASGMGSYHGKFGIDTFSHKKSILHKFTFFEPSLKYPPYTKRKLKIIKLLMG